MLGMTSKLWEPESLGANGEQVPKAIQVILERGASAFRHYISQVAKQFERKCSKLQRPNGRSMSRK